MSNTPAEIAVETLLAVKEYDQVTVRDIARISKALDIKATELFAEVEKNNSSVIRFS